MSRNGMLGGTHNLLLKLKKKPWPPFSTFPVTCAGYHEKGVKIIVFSAMVLSTVCNTGVFGRYPTPKRWGTNSTTKMVTLQINDTTKMHGAHS
jgi:hypothetical protein